MTHVTSPVPERYPHGLQSGGGVAAGVRNGPRLGGRLDLLGFHCVTHGNPGDRFLAIDDEASIKMWVAYQDEKGA